MAEPIPTASPVRGLSIDASGKAGNPLATTPTAAPTTFLQRIGLSSIFGPTSASGSARKRPHDAAFAPERNSHSVAPEAPMSISSSPSPEPEPKPEPPTKKPKPSHAEFTVDAEAVATMSPVEKGEVPETVFAQTRRKRVTLRERRALQTLAAGSKTVGRARVAAAERTLQTSPSSGRGSPSNLSVGKLPAAPKTEPRMHKTGMRLVQSSPVQRFAAPWVKESRSKENGGAKKEEEYEEKDNMRAESSQKQEDRLVRRRQKVPAKVLIPAYTLKEESSDIVSPLEEHLKAAEADSPAGKSKAKPKSEEQSEVGESEFEAGQEPAVAEDMEEEQADEEVDQDKDEDEDGDDQPAPPSPELGTRFFDDQQGHSEEDDSSSSEKGFGANAACKPDADEGRVKNESTTRGKNAARNQASIAKPETASQDGDADGDYEYDSGLEEEEVKEEPEAEAAEDEEAAAQEEDADADGEDDEPAAAASSPPSSPKEEFIIDHLVEWDFAADKPQTADPPLQIVIRVAWEGAAEDTWEPEADLHADARRTLMAFWRAHGGRAAAIAKRYRKGVLDKTYLAHGIVKHREAKDGGEKTFLVDWVGYPVKERTWEAEENLPEEMVREYLEGKGIKAEE